LKSRNAHAGFEMMSDVLVVFLSIGLWLALGYPVARKLAPLVVWPALAAPALGLAIFAVFTVVFYASGLRLQSAFKICVGLAIPGIVLAVRDGLHSQFNRSHGAIMIAFLMAMLLVLLPKWLGPPDFSVFQTNAADQLNYTSGAWMALHYDYPTIRDMDFPTRLATGFGISIPTLMRPAAALMLGSFASAVGQPVLLTSYAYLGALQLCIFFTSLFVLRNVIELSGTYATFVGLGVTLGFFAQYMFDINGWSALAALSVIMLYVGLLILGLVTGPTGKTNQVVRGALGQAGFFWSMLVCMAGVWYIYPESWTLVAAISMPVLAYQFFISEDRRHFFRRLLLLVLAFGCALALCALAWRWTVGVVPQQWRFLADPWVQAQTMDWWWKITHRYLLGYDEDWNNFDLIPLWYQSFFGFLYRVFSIAVSFLAGLLGVYFLQPSAVGVIPWGEIPTVQVSESDYVWFWVSIVWKLGLLVTMVGLIGFWFSGLLHASDELRQGRHRAFFVAMLGGIVLISGLFLAGQSYAGGRALMWLSPIWMLAFIGPLLSDERNLVVRIVAVGYVAIQIGFGGYRSYAAAEGAFGAHYHSPYPVDRGRKMFYQWDYASLQAALRGCTRVSIDIHDLYHEHFVEMAVADMGLHWSSRKPVWALGREVMQKQIDDPDCAVTTLARSIQPSYRVIWLRRNDSVLKFYRGEASRLILVPNLPPELDSEGIAADETLVGGQAWINGHAVIRIPNNPKAPIKRLNLALDAETLPVGIRIVINGRPVLDEIASRTDNQVDFSTTVELPNFNMDAWLNIEIDCDRCVSLDNKPTRGARLRLLSLER
jgi:hypothetical protein